VGLTDALNRLDEIQAAPEKERSFTEVVDLVLDLQKTLQVSMKLSANEIQMVKNALAARVPGTSELWERWSTQAQRGRLSLGEMLGDIEKLPGFAKYTTSLQDPVLRKLLEQMQFDQGMSVSPETASEVTDESKSSTST
jgi:hypothetical protein